MTRSARLRKVARALCAAHAEAQTADKLIRLARATEPVADGDWDEDTVHLAQAVDAVLDGALEAFQAGETEQGISLIVAGAATVDALLTALNADDADEVQPDTQGVNSGRATTRPPRDNLIRAIYPGIRLRDARSAGDMPPMYGHFAVFNRWTEIESFWEGTFLERIAPGAFTKTIKENRANMRVLFQHGRDPVIGDKPLGPIDELAEDEIGARYEVSLLDTTYTRDLLPGLREGLYGASFRFRVMKEELVSKPEPSDYNPTAMPERTIKEAQVMEFGPVTFPAYDDATAGVRSMTDDFIVRLLMSNPTRLQQLISSVPNAAALSNRAGQSHSDNESRRDATTNRLVVIRNPNRRIAQHADSRSAASSH